MSFILPIFIHFAHFCQFPSIFRPDVTVSGVRVHGAVASDATIRAAVARPQRSPGDGSASRVHGLYGPSACFVHLEVLQCPCTSEWKRGVMCEYK